MNHLHLYHLGYKNHLFDRKFSVTVGLEAMLSIHIDKELEFCLYKINIWKGLHRCWLRMLETKCVGDNFEILAVFVDKILYTLHKRRVISYY